MTAWQAFCFKPFEHKQRHEMNTMVNRQSFALCILALSVGAWAQTTSPTAGLQPDRRPDGAPQLAQATLTPEKRDQVLRGIERPIPGNVESIATTGSWWVPLRNPGMTGPYDLRGWHSITATGTPGSASVR